MGSQLFMHHARCVISCVFVCLCDGCVTNVCPLKNGDLFLPMPATV